MAHPTDHYETFHNLNNKPRHKLNMSPSTMNKTPATLASAAIASIATISNVRIKPNGNKFPDVDANSHAYILISNFIRENPTWAISSAYDYCLKYYKEFGATKEIFAAALHAYIMSKD